MLKKLLILILIPFLLCSCSRNNIEEISFASWGSATETKILHSLISEFEKNNPDIKVNFIHVPQNYFQKLHLLFASNQAPDVVFINNLYLPLYAKKLEPLDNFLDKNDFYPQSIQAMSYDSHLYAIPRDISNLVFYYNKSLIKQNLNPDWNFSDFEKLLQKKYCKNCYATSFEPDVFIASPYITTLGYEKGINFYKNLEGRCAPNPAQVGSSTLAQMFIEGRIALYLSGRWMYPKISETAKFPFGVITFPGIVPADSSGWAISKDSKHKDSAKKFITFLASKKSIEFMTKSGLIVPARIDASYLLNNDNEKMFLKAIQKSEPQVISKDYKKKRDKLNKELFN